VRCDLFAGPKHRLYEPRLDTTTQSADPPPAHFSTLIPVAGSTYLAHIRLTCDRELHAFHVPAIAPLTIGMHFRPRTHYTLLIRLRTAVHTPCRAS
jgi:hypothetical protein